MILLVVLEELQLFPVSSITTTSLYHQIQTFLVQGSWAKVMISNLFTYSSSLLLISLFYRFILKDREDFFTSAQRSQIVWQILLRTSYDQAQPDKVVIRFEYKTLAECNNILRLELSALRTRMSTK